MRNRRVKKFKQSVRAQGGEEQKNTDSAGERSRRSSNLDMLEDSVFSGDVDSNKKTLIMPAIA